MKVRQGRPHLSSSVNATLRSPNLHYRPPRGATGGPRLPLPPSTKPPTQINPRPSFPSLARTRSPNLFQDPSPPAMAAAASASAAAACAQKEFTEGELEVAAILRDLPAIVRARCRRRRRPEIPSWGRRRPRTLPVEKPAAVADRGEGAASPDTPLAFPEESGEEEAAAKKVRTPHEEWVQEQRGVLASLSQENAHLLKQIDEYRARLQSSRSINDSLKQMQSKLRQRQQEEEERKLRAETTVIGRPALGLDLNEPADEDEGAKAQAQAQAAAVEWSHRGQQRAMMYKAAAARRRRREIRQAKAAAASRTRRVG